jgi:VanZ family protein
MVKRSILIAFLIIIFFGSVAPVYGPAVRGLDKIQHFLTYFLLTFLFYWNGFSSVFSLLLTTGYGGAMEFVQYFVPYRQSSFADILANSLGAFLFFALVAFRKRTGAGHRQGVFIKYVR